MKLRIQKKDSVSPTENPEFEKKIDEVKLEVGEIKSCKHIQHRKIIDYVIGGMLLLDLILAIVK